MGKKSVRLVLNSQAIIKGKPQKADFLVLEGDCPSGISAGEVEKLLQGGKLKAIVPAPDNSKTEKEQSKPDEGGA